MREDRAGEDRQERDAAEDEQQVLAGLDRRRGDEGPIHPDANGPQLPRENRHTDVDDLLGRAGDGIRVRDVPDLLRHLAGHEVALDDAGGDQRRERVRDERLLRVVDDHVLDAGDGGELVDGRLNRRGVARQQEIDARARQAPGNGAPLGGELVRQVRGQRADRDPPGDRRQRDERHRQEQDDLPEQTEANDPLLVHAFTAAAQSVMGAHRPFTTLVKYTLSRP